MSNDQERPRERSPLQKSFDQARGEFYVALLDIEPYHATVLNLTDEHKAPHEAAAVIVAQLEDGCYLMGFSKEPLDLSNPFGDVSKFYTVDEIAGQLHQPDKWPQRESLREISAAQSPIGEGVDKTLRPYLFGPLFSLVDCYHLHAALYMNNIPGGQADLDQALDAIPNSTALLRDMIIHTELKKRVERRKSGAGNDNPAPDPN